MTNDIQKNNAASQNPPVNQVNLDEEIKQFEQSYQKEVGAKEKFSFKLEQLEKDQTEIETDIRNREEKIKILLGKLREIKEEIENELKRLNELKEADKEIKEDKEEIKKVEEKVKTLEEKLAGFKLDA